VRGLELFLLLAAVAGLACEDGSYRAIGADIRSLTQDVSDRQETAAARLIAVGRRAIPQIEIALHTAPDRGRRRLVSVLEQLGDDEAIPILRHLAVFDGSPEVRGACEGALKAWAVVTDARGRSAGLALQRIRERRDRGEGPLPERAASP
jgi:hypothetical protein